MLSHLCEERFSYVIYYSPLLIKGISQAQTYLAIMAWCLFVQFKLGYEVGICEIPDTTKPCADHPIFWRYGEFWLSRCQASSY
jgi:hypothetical protein